MNSGFSNLLRLLMISSVTGFAKIDGVFSESITLFEGDTNGTGVYLDTTVDQSVWDEEYILYIYLTMPDSLDEIGEWDGLLGNGDGDHPYPYFTNAENEDGLFFERQNGPHPRREVDEYIGLDQFIGGEDYTITIYHLVIDDEDCFQMWTENAHAEWCYDYDYDNTPLYAGCGYEPGNEDFSGSVKKVVIEYNE